MNERLEGLPGTGLKKVAKSKMRWLAAALAASVLIIVARSGKHDDGPPTVPARARTAERMPIVPTGGPTTEAPPISMSQPCVAPLPGAVSDNRHAPPPAHWWMLFPTTVYARGSQDIHAGGRGDVHIDRFNGVRYDFQGVGEYFALLTEDGSMAIQVRQQPFGDLKTVSVTTAIAMKVAGDTVGVYAGQAVPLRVNHGPQSLENPVLRLPHGGEVQRQGDGVVVIWPSQSQVRILYGNYLDYDVTVCPSDQGKMGGLMGDPDAPPSSLRARGGTAVQLAGLEGNALRQGLYRVFGDSWRISQRESLFDYADGQSTKTVTDLTFLMIQPRQRASLRRSVRVPRPFAGAPELRIPCRSPIACSM